MGHWSTKISDMVEDIKDGKDGKEHCMLQHGNEQK